MPDLPKQYNPAADGPVEDRVGLVMCLPLQEAERLRSERLRDESTLKQYSLSLTGLYLLLCASSAHFQSSDLFHNT